MYKRKSFYEAPESELLVIRFEGNIMSGGIEDSTEKDPFEGFDENEG